MLHVRVLHALRQLQMAAFRYSSAWIQCARSPSTQFFPPSWAPMEDFSRGGRIGAPARARDDLCGRLLEVILVTHAKEAIVSHASHRRCAQIRRVFSFKKQAKPTGSAHAWIKRRTTNLIVSQAQNIIWRGKAPSCEKREIRKNFCFFGIFQHL